MNNNPHRYGCRCTSCNAGQTLHPKAKKRLQKDQLALPEPETDQRDPAAEKKRATKK